MLAKIAAATEPRRPRTSLSGLHEFYLTHRPATTAEAIATVVEDALDTVPCGGVFVPTRTGTTARMLSRYKPSVWIVAFSRDAAVCQGLTFSYGVWPEELTAEPEDWRGLAAAWMREHQVAASSAMLVAGPSSSHPDANHRIEFMNLGAGR